MVNTNIIIAGSQFSGFKNYATASFSVAYAGGNIAAGGYVGPLTASTPLNNTNAVSEVLVQYTGLETFYRLIPGNIVTDYPTAGAATYEIQSLAYFTGGILFVDSYIVNQTAGVVAIPPITFSCLGCLGVAPF